MAVKQKIRCAIYTRKSSEDEGGRKEFNSNDAQREAGENYVASQKYNGWVAIPTVYDDYGFSGGTLDRPALQSLFKDAEAGLIDVVIVYKIDRLSRSLNDFAEISKRFDKWGVSFVAVTQEINTMTSAGRMMLNILMTFAQYERELISERIRDKVLATRQKGKWWGSVTTHGFKIVDKKLVKNDEEAPLVEHIFQRYIEVQSVQIVVSEINRQGYRTRKGNLWSALNVYRILHNYAYIGKLKVEDKIIEGEHDGFIDQATWDRVHEILKSNRNETRKYSRINAIAPLKGLLRCGHCDKAMTPTYSTHNNKKYCYYCCNGYIKHGISSGCPIPKISAKQVEGLVRQQIIPMLSSPLFIAKIAELTNENSQELNLIFKEDFWTEISAPEYNRLLSLLIENVVIYKDNLEVIIKTNGVNSIIGEYKNAEN